jgi:hypothetical protein
MPGSVSNSAALSNTSAGVKPCLLASPLTLTSSSTSSSQPAVWASRLRRRAILARSTAWISVSGPDGVACFATLNRADHVPADSVQPFGVGGGCLLPQFFQPVLAKVMLARSQRGRDVGQWVGLADGDEAHIRRAATAAFGGCRHALAHLCQVGGNLGCARWIENHSARFYQ